MVSTGKPIFDINDPFTRSALGMRCAERDYTPGNDSAIDFRTVGSDPVEMDLYETILGMKGYGEQRDPQRLPEDALARALWHNISRIN